MFPRGPHRYLLSAVPQQLALLALFNAMTADRLLLAPGLHVSVVPWFSEPAQGLA